MTGSVEQREEKKTKRSPLDGSVEGLIYRLLGFAVLLLGFVAGYPAPVNVLVAGVVIIAGILADALKVYRFQISAHFGLERDED